MIWTNTITPQLKFICLSLKKTGNRSHVIVKTEGYVIPSLPNDWLKINSWKKIKLCPSMHTTHMIRNSCFHIYKTISLALMLENIKWLNECKTSLQTPYIYTWIKQRGQHHRSFVSFIVSYITYITCSITCLL